MSKKAVIETANETMTENEQQDQTATETESVTTQTPGVNGGQQPVKVFTQEDLNAIVAQRVQQERRKYADYDELRQEVENLRGSQQRVAELEQQNSQLAASSKEKSVEAAIAKAAGAIGLDPEAALKLADLDTLAVDDAGKATNAADVVKAVAEKYPGLLKRPMPTVSPLNQQANGQNVTPEQKEAALRQRVFGGGAASFWSAGGVRYEE